MEPRVPVQTCILLHGFTGLPMELGPLQGALSAKGYQVRTPALAGHDGTYASLKGVTYEDWIESAESAARAAISSGPVHLIGFSMGALLALVVSLRIPVTSLTLLSPAVYVAHPVLWLRQVSLFLRAKTKPDSPEREYVQRRPSGFLWTPPSALREFRKLVVATRTELPHITAPLCIIQGQRDEIVHPNGALFISSRVASDFRQLHSLSQSRHHVCLDVESQTVMELVTRFLQRSLILGDAPV